MIVDGELKYIKHNVPEKDLNVIIIPCMQVMPASTKWVYSNPTPLRLDNPIGHNGFVLIRLNMTLYVVYKGGGDRTNVSNL